jgi:hypothetical protein
LIANISRHPILIGGDGIHIFSYSRNYKFYNKSTSRKAKVIEVMFYPRSGKNKKIWDLSYYEKLANFVETSEETTHMMMS